MKKFLSIRIILLICLLGTLVFLIGCTPPVSIHTGSISGTVKTPYPGEQIDFWPCAARVDVSSSGQFTVSSYSDGSYILNNVPVGQHTITVFKHGFLTAQKTVEVIEGEITSDVDFTLESKVPLDQLGGTYTYYYGFNLDMTPFNSLKVRQAINYAIDKQTLLDEVNTEFAVSNVVAQGPLPTGLIGYNSSLMGYSYDVSEAQELLSQAGYPEGFSTDLYYSIGDFYYFIAQKIQTYLAQVGINAELHGIEWIELIGLVEQGELPFFQLGWGADTPDPTDYLYALYHSASISNAVHYNDTTIDNLIDQAWETIDETEFIQLIQQIESTIVDDAPAIYIYH